MINGGLWLHKYLISIFIETSVSHQYHELFAVAKYDLRQSLSKLPKVEGLVLNILLL